MSKRKSTDTGSERSNKSYTGVENLNILEGKVGKFLSLDIQQPKAIDLKNEIFQISDRDSEVTYFFHLKLRKFCTHLLQFHNNTDSQDAHEISKAFKLHVRLLQYNYDDYLMTFPCRKPRCTDQGPVPLSRMLVRVVGNGNYGLLQFFVKYGKCEINIRDRAVLELVLHDFIFWRTRSVQEIEGGDIFKAKEQSTNLICRMIQEGNINFKRMTLFLITLDVITYQQICKYHQFTDIFFRKCQRRVQCVNDIMEASPEPFITFQDIRNFVTTYLTGSGKSELSDHLCKCLKDLFPKSQEMYNPRSLLDLCRCKVRDSLVEDICLVKQVSQLPIPSLLKEFVLFDSKDINANLEVDCEIEEQIFMTVPELTMLDDTLTERMRRERERSFFAL